jgi:hypothetical protein
VENEKGKVTMDEPSVLDYLKEKINPRNWGKEGSISFLPPRTAQETPEQKNLLAFPWKPLAALAFALIAQRLLEPTINNSTFAIILYVIAATFVVLSVYEKEWQFPDLRLEESAAMDQTVKLTPLLVSLLLILVTFVIMSDNTFTSLNVIIWFLAIFFVVYAFWLPKKEIDLPALGRKVIDYLKKPFLNIHITSWTLLVIAVFLLAAFFHFYKIATVPLDMTSDHAEKLEDVQRVLNGQYSIFMSNNGGREAMQFYLVAAMIKWFGFGIDMTTLKVSMGLVFLFGLVFVYLLGKEIGNRWTGLLAMLFMGFASWANILERAGMRQVLVTVFVAPTLYFLLRGFRRGNRNDYVMAGIFMGIGLWGYTAFRIMPVVIGLAVLLYVLHHKEKDKRREAWLAFGMIALLTLVFFIPILRFAIQYPDAFNYRSLSRMTSLEQPVIGNYVKIFFSNAWKALTMTFWKDGSTWVNSVTDRPALDVVTAALYAIGLVVVLARLSRSATGWICFCCCPSRY